LIVSVTAFPSNEIEVNSGGVGGALLIACPTNVMTLTGGSV
jgi:hypothetical protein